MRIFEVIADFFSKNATTSWHMPVIAVPDVIEMLIIAFLLYKVMAWMRDTRAWALFKGLIFVLIFYGLAALLDMQTIVWLAGKAFTYGLIAFFVVFQPELRKALEQLGQRRFFSWFNFSDFQKNNADRYTDRTINEIVRACFDMGKVKTGALICIEREIVLGEYERTGIAVDGRVSSQLLINIFEKNTPLHDGAVIVRGDRIVAATCYFPLSDNLGLSKELGTRHRAAVGISELNDSMTIVVSEETGSVSIAERGVLSRDLTPEELKMRITANQKRFSEESRFSKFKRRIAGNAVENVEEAGKESDS